MVGKAFLGEVAADEAHLHIGIHQVTPLPTRILLGLFDAHLLADEGAPDVEAAVVQQLVVFVDGLHIAHHLVGEDIGEARTAGLRGLALLVDGQGILGCHGWLLRLGFLDNGGLLLVDVLAQIMDAEKILDEGGKLTAYR